MSEPGIDIELPRPRPGAVTLEGRYVRLEPLSLAHAGSLYAASAGSENRSRFDYLFEPPPDSEADVRAWIERVSILSDPMYFAVVDKDSGGCGGRQALMNIKPEHGSIELGGIYWGPGIARTRRATEAVWLHLHYAFETLGYRRFEWKCNNRNEASKSAALRFGFTFEGVFRQHMVVKGSNRDTAWYSITDTEWPALRSEYERWLEPSNFDAAGRQLSKLETRRPSDAS